jgi:thioesterase domain-containing protein
MLVPIQTSGKKPPLFFVHGLHGLMMLGSTFARAFGPDQPLYVINANGMDGRRPVIDNVRDMVMAYVSDIHGARPLGPVVIGSTCEGCLAAIEVARELRERGRQVGPVILADPPPVPPRYARQNPRDPQSAEMFRRLYQRVHDNMLKYASRPYHDMPFDAADAQQVHIATLAGVNSLIALATHVPRPFLGPGGIVLSAERAVGFLHPEMPWSKLLPGPRVIQVLPWDHEHLFRGGREQVARAIKFLLDEAPCLEALLDSRGEPVPA